MSELCAVVGIGQTHHKSARPDVSIAGLVREAASRALEDAEMRWQGIDAVGIGKAPDMSSGAGRGGGGGGSRALEDAEMRWQDIDAVVIGKAPDMFEGVVMPEAYLADALGATGKPMMRGHT